MRLTISIPALNEEESIASIIDRCLRSIPHIKASGVAEVQIVVVSDGSTDRTVEIAKSYETQGVALIVFANNQGYGAAIQAGWEHGGGDLLGFLDADGTCDPMFFADLCRTVLAGADIAVGNRMGPDSRMPRVRRVGNRIYALLLSGLSAQNVGDTASGMRVLRKSCLQQLQPLPTGLHFTPAMTARGLMQNLNICELPMSYEERQGRSKLSVVKDGYRFLKIILESVLFLRPSRLTGPIILMLLTGAFALFVRPVVDYVRYQHIEDWMIYRSFLILLLLDLAGLIWSATVIAERTIALTSFRHEIFLMTEGKRWYSGGGSFRMLLYSCSLLPFVALALVWPGLYHFLKSGTIPFDVLHWPRVLIAFELVVLPAQFWITALLLRTVSTLSIRQPFLLRK